MDTETNNQGRGILSLPKKTKMKQFRTKREAFLYGQLHVYVLMLFNKEKDFASLDLAINETDISNGTIKRLELEAQKRGVLINLFNYRPKKFLLLMARQEDIDLFEKYRQIQLTYRRGLSTKSEFQSAIRKIFSWTD